MEKLLSLYLFDSLPEDKKVEVEAHLLECEVCLAELYQLNPALEILEETPEKFLDALHSRESLFTRIVSPLKKNIKSLKEKFVGAVIRWL